MDTKRVSLKLEPTSFIPNDVDNMSPDSIKFEQSPVSRAVYIGTRPSSRASGSDDEREPDSGPHRSGSVSSGQSDREIRKRSRVKPDQLVHLESFFALNRAPTAARRREISRLLDMRERQTQIWFQNRRAKAKIQETKQNRESIQIPPESPPKLSTGFDVDLDQMIHEDEPVTIIPCTDLAIGTWRRIATTSGRHDLVAYVCDVKNCLTWFIHSAGFGFKMELPFETIITAKFANAAPGFGLATFELSQPPIFYLEDAGSPDANGTSSRYWKRCSDWTEGHQATEILHHELIGSAVQLSHVLQRLPASTTADAPIHYPSYHVEPPPPSSPTGPSPLQSFAVLSGPGYHYNYQPEDIRAPLHDNRVSSIKRESYTGPSLISHSPDSAYSNESDHPSSYSNPAPTHQYATVPHPQPIPSSHLDASTNEYATGPRVQHVTSSFHHANVYARSEVSQATAPQLYTAQPVPRTFHNDVARLTQAAYEVDLQMRRSSIGENQYLQPPPSPPLLTTPYHPPPHLLHSPVNHSREEELLEQPNNIYHSEVYHHGHHNYITPQYLAAQPVYAGHHRHHLDH